MSAPTPPSRIAAALTVALALGEFAWALDGVRSSMTAAVLAPLTLLAGIVLLRVNCLEARLAVVMTVSAPLLLTTLATTIGLPGQEPHRSAAGVLVGWVLPFAVLVAIDADRRARTRRPAPPPTHPYAR